MRFCKGLKISVLDFPPPKRKVIEIREMAEKKARRLFEANLYDYTESLKENFRSEWEKIEKQEISIKEKALDLNMNACQKDRLAKRATLQADLRKLQARRMTAMKVTADHKQTKDTAEKVLSVLKK